MPERLCFSLNRTLLHWKDTTKHLDHFICNDPSDDKEIRYEECYLIHRVNSVCANFKVTLNNVVLQIFTQCRHVYGRQTWTLNARVIH